MLEVKKIRKKLNLTQGALADKLGVNRRTVQKWESGESKMSGNAVLKIQELEIKNELKGVNDIEVKEPLSYIKTKAGLVYEELKSGKYLLSAPLVPIKAHASYISEFQDIEFISELENTTWIVDTLGRGNYRAFEVMNDSMDDDSKRSFPDGSYVLGRELQKHLWRNKLHIGGVRGFYYWVIVHKQTIMIKEIVSHNVEKGIITCHSLNDSPEYQDFDLHLSDVIELYNIIKKQTDI